MKILENNPDQMTDSELAAAVHEHIWGATTPLSTEDQLMSEMIDRFCERSWIDPFPSDA